MKMIRPLIDGATRLIGYVRRNRRVSLKGGPGAVKVNIGCGLALAKDWINVDASLNALVASWPRFAHQLLYRLSGSNRYYSLDQYCELLEKNIFVHHDLSHSIPLRDQTADFIFSSHFLEHLFRRDAERLLKDCLRVLKHGGTIRICVPDLAYAFSLYASGEKEKMLENYFFVEDRESFLARHKYMYDFELLKKLLESIGYTQVTRCEYRHGRTPDIDQLDNRPEETLFVEAVKP